MSSIVRDLQGFGKGIQRDFEVLANNKSWTEESKNIRLIALLSRVIGVSAIAVALWMNFALTAIVILGRDYIIMGQNAQLCLGEVDKPSKPETYTDRALNLLSTGLSMASKATAVASEGIKEKCHPLLHGTWVLRHVYLLVTEYEEKAKAEPKARV